MKTQITGRRGFTIVELLVVIGIIAILAGLLLPVFARAKAKGRDSACLNNLKQIGLGVMMYADENRGYLPDAEPMPSDPLDPANPMPRISDVLSISLGVAVGGTNTSAIFRCPSDTQGWFQKEGTSYEWNYVYSGKNLNELKSAGRFRGSIPTEKAMLMFDFENFHGASPSTTNGQSNSKNVLYGDGHVKKI